MAFLNLEVPKASPGYRKRRFAAFLIDAAFVMLFIFVVYKIVGRPDFLSVSAAMDAAKQGASGPDSQALADTVFDLFNAAYWQSLMIWFSYEVIFQLIFSGATPGKLLMKLRIVQANPERSWLAHNLLMVLRSAVKFTSLYLLQGFPFLISALSLFTNSESRAGHDRFAKTYVKDMKGE